MHTERPSTASCIIHCRVSTAKQAYEGESLEVQEEICLKIATDNGWRLSHRPWRESFSGRKDQRPVFADVLAFLDAHPGRVQFYLFRSIDRFTRGGSLAYEQMKRELAIRGVEMVDSYGIIQPPKNTLAELGFEYDWSRSSPSEIAEIVVATSAKHEVTNILTRLIGQEIRLVQRGYKVRQPHDGFVNTKIAVDGRKRTIEAPDPERAKYFIAMFEMRASGQYTDAQICKRVNAMGYRTRVHNRWDASHRHVIGRSGEHRLVPKRLQEIIQRPIYCGIVCEKWTRGKPIKAAYEGLVSIETFNAANRGKITIRETVAGHFEMLRDRQRGRATAILNKDNPLFPFRKVVLCPLCGKPLLGSSPRGSTGKRFPIYHCSRKHKYFGVSKAVLEANLTKFMNRLRFHPDVLDSIHGILVDRYYSRQHEILDAASFMGHSVAELKTRLAETVRAFKTATTPLMRRALEAEAEDLERQIDSTRTVRDRLEITEEDIHAFIKDVRAIMERPIRLLNDPANARELQALYSLVFDQFPTYAEIADGTAKLAWIFSLSSASETPESALVHLQGFKWNLIEQTILRWKQSSFDLPMRRSISENVPEVPTSLKRAA